MIENRMIRIRGKNISLTSIISNNSEDVKKLKKRQWYKVYSFLCKFNNQTSRSISKALNIARSNVNRILNDFEFKHDYVDVKVAICKESKKPVKHYSLK